MNALYERYGQLMIEQEILNNKSNEVKRAIAEGLNKQAAEKKETVNE